MGSVSSGLLADQLREPLVRWNALRARAALAQMAGRFDEAEQLAEAARAVGRRGQHPPTEALAKR